MIFQDPLSAMHPYYTVGNQIVEAYRIHNDVTKKEARKRAIDMLDRVGIPQPHPRRRLPAPVLRRHAPAGDDRHGAVCDPDCSSPTSRRRRSTSRCRRRSSTSSGTCRREFNSAVIIITHDLGVVAEVADDILVMYAGRAVEYGRGDDIFAAPQHPYTWGLLGSMPRLDRERTERLVRSRAARRA